MGGGRANGRWGCIASVLAGGLSSWLFLRYEKSIGSTASGIILFIGAAILFWAVLQLAKTSDASRTDGPT
jgi:hypothetical protein